MRSLLRRLEVDGELAEHRHEVGVVEPRVAVPVDRPDRSRSVVKSWSGLFASGQGLPEDAAAVSAERRLTVSLETPGKPAELREAPVVQLERPVMAQRQHEAVSERGRDERVGDCQRSKDRFRSSLQCVSNAASDSNRSSGSRRNSS